MKTHLSFVTSKLAESVDFYSALFGEKPSKVLSDYALFITEEPGLELTLEASSSTPQASGDHYGVFVESVDDVERAITRLQRAGLVSAIEREETCCYANQTKVWATDPMGRRWEIYTVHEDTEQRGAAGSSCCTDSLDESGVCCTA
ncbi:MAG: ArsI/CadI family heavy metal resistance metalloenzyme [Candidatus Tumulicola sp.]